MLALITCNGRTLAADHMSCHRITKTLHDLKHFIPRVCGMGTTVFVLTMYSDEARQSMRWYTQPSACVDPQPYHSIYKTPTTQRTLQRPKSAP
jgi:hypothetical protein